MLATLLRRAAATLFLLAAAALAPAWADDAPVTVYAAASLKNALDAVASQWQHEAGKKVVFSYAASSALAKQIEAAAPADVFISADLEWMDYLAQRKLVNESTRVRLLGNTLVLVAPKASTVALKIAPGFALAKTLADGRLAVADVKAVPAGKYAKAALEKLGVWADVEAKLAQAENVRAALALVSRGEAPLGIVYRTDANADSGVKVIDTFPDGSHPAIVYPAAVLANSTNPDASAFLAYLRSAQAKALFEQQGFTVLP